MHRLLSLRIKPRFAREEALFKLGILIVVRLQVLIGPYPEWVVEVNV